MCEQAEISYLDGDIVWVKLGSCWWPGEVVGAEKLPPDLLPSFRKPPIAVVKFFEEDTYEYVKNLNSIFKYTCSRKNEFINKGLYMYRTKHGHMDKFPDDVLRAETAVGGDILILTRDEFQETKKESYASLFSDPKKTPVSSKKGRGRPSDSSKSTQPIRKLSEKINYKVHILPQGSKTPNQNQPTESVPTPSTSRAGSEPTETQEIPVKNVTYETEKSELPNTNSVTNTPTISSVGQYVCHACQFSTTRLNVLILHNKSHSVSYIPYTPTPVKKKTILKSPKSPPVTPKIQKPRKPRQVKPERNNKKSQSKKRAADPEPVSEVKKPKTDEEIKCSLLADWDDGDEESNDESSAMVMARSPEVPIAAESPPVPTPAELPSAQIPEETQISDKKPEDRTTNDKPETSSDSKYEFCEDEEWHVEADYGRKIPRVTEPSKVKSVGIDDDKIARDVAEFLNTSTVLELPSVPEPLKIEENFPELSIVKSPDKLLDKQDHSSPEKKNTGDTPPSKTIFKTKTFFRSRHSRSQDAIGKYVAEQLNAAERMDLAESELNGADVRSSLEIRVSPPLEPVKVARLAPKIQLKKMKAEAAQLREREKCNAEKSNEEEKCIAEKSKEDINTISSKELATSVPIVSSLTETKENDVSTLTNEIECSIVNNTTKAQSDEDCVNSDTPKLNNAKQEVENSSKHDIEIKNNENESQVDKSESNQVTENNLEQKTKRSYVDKSFEPFMNESTASAVDALLSVSREADRVTKVISDDPPEDLFEEDVKDNVSFNCLNVTQSNYQTVDESNHQKLILTDVENSSTPHSDIEGVEIAEQKNVCSSTVLPEENNITESFDIQADKDKGEEDSFNIQDTNTSSNDIENSVAEQHTNTFTTTVDSSIEEVGLISPSKNDIEDAVNVPSNSDTEERLTHTTLSKNDTEEAEKNISSQSEISNDENKCYTSDITPSESVLQVAEALINLPTTTLQSKPSLNHQDNSNQQVLEDTKSAVTTVLQSNIHSSNDDNITSRFESEQEKSENLNAAKSLVQMSETIDHKIKIQENSKEMSSILNRNEDDVKISNELIKEIGGEIIGIPRNEPTTIPCSELITKPGIELVTKVNSEVITKVNTEIDHKITNINNDNKQNKHKPTEFTHSSKLLKILEEPCIPKVMPVKKTINKQVGILGKEKILNFEVGKSIIKPEPQSLKQNTIIRRAGSNTTILNNITEVTTPDKIILSRTSKPAQDGSPVQTYTIQTTPEPPPSGEGNTIIIQQKIRKILKPMSKLQKIKSPVITVTGNKKTQDVKSKDETMFDINSMPVVLSDDILTPENIEKMPIVMTDGNLITNTNNPPKLVKSKQCLSENDKVGISSMSTKSEIKTLLMNSSNEVSKITPNILSKSSKLRGAKPMLVIDKVIGKPKYIMTKAETPIKEMKQPQTLIQSAPQSSAKAEPFIILPTQSSRQGKTQKIVINPQTGKAHILVGKGTESSLNVTDNKPVSAKLIPSSSDGSTPGSTVMIITNDQGAQSRIVLTPEHEKILFPNKQQSVSQLKTVTHRVTSGGSSVQKTIVTTPNQNKTQTRLVPKQKSAVITSKGQLIVGRIGTTTQNIAPLPEIRPSPKRIIAAEPKKLVQTIQKNSSERLIFLQQKSGAVMQLTTAQFEHLQRTGQIIQKAPSEKVMVQKSITITPNETVVVQKHRVRKATNESPSPIKKAKHEIAIAPAPTMTPLPALTPLSNTAPPVVSNVPSLLNSASATNYSDLDNIEELLPSTAIARQDTRTSPPESVVTQTTPAPAPLSDPGQLLAVPGEHFGGPPGSFYLCVEENGTFTVIDNRPLVLENNQLVPMAEPLPVLAQPERRDILEAALANSDVFHGETSRDDAPDFRDLNANVSVHCRVSETSTTLNQPIMTPVEVPSKADSEPTVPSTLEDGLAVIGVTPLTVPTSLELPITVTDPRIALKTTDPLSNNNYGAALLPSPNTEMTFATAPQMEVSVVGPISMPLLTEEDSVGKSMPILTDEVADRTVSSVESTIGSPSSIDVRESENEDNGQWPRRLLTPCSDTSEASAEIPLQPVMQVSANDLSHNS